MTAYLAAFALGQPILGPLSDAHGRRIAIGVGLLLFAFGWRCENGWRLALASEKGSGTRARVDLDRLGGRKGRLVAAGRDRASERV